MKKENKSIIIFELFTIVLIGFFINVSFSKGIRWENIQFVCILIAMGSLFPIIVEIKQRQISLINGKSMIIFGLLYWLLLDPLLLREGIEEFPPEIVLKVFLMVILFLIMVYIGYLIKWPPYFTKIFGKLDYGYSFNSKKLVIFTAVCFFLSILPIIIWGGGLDNIIWTLTHAGRFGASWGRAVYGGWTDYFKTILGYFQPLCVQLAAFYTIFVGKNILLALFAFIPLYLIFQSGTRNALASAFAPAILLYYLDNFNKKKKLRFTVYIVLFLLFSVMQLQLVIRSSSPEQSIAEIVNEYYLGILKTKPVEYHRDDQFYRMLQIAELVPARLPYSGEFLLLRAIHHFVPRAIWPNKPQGITFFFEEAIAEEGVTATWAVSIIGDFFLCQGWLGICIAGIFMGFLAKQFDSLIEMSRRSPAVLLIYTYGLVFLLVAIRSYMIIYEGWYIFIFLYLLLKYIGKKRSRMV